MLFDDPFLDGITVLWGVFCVFVLPVWGLYLFFDLAKQNHFTIWGTILYLADNMEDKTSSLFWFFLREIIFWLIIVGLAYLAIIDAPVIEWLVRVTDNMYNSFTAR